MNKKTPDNYISGTTLQSEFYSNHAPTHLNFVAASNGFQPRPLNGPFTWCDYGCGNAITANVLAGCYPDAKFYGVDYLPSRIRTAKSLSNSARLENTVFIQKRFSALAKSDIPQLDFAIIHGILSRADETERNATLDDATKRLKPGGILLTGVNAMPGWAARLPMRNMIYSLTKDSDNTLERARVGLEWMHKLKTANVKYFRDNQALAETIEELEKADLRHMEHEYFNVNLRAFYFAEMQALMESRGLKFAGCARIFLNMVDLAVPIDLRDEFRSVSSRAELEAKRDFIRNETFRSDIWVKGEPISTEKEWLDVNQKLVFGTLEPFLNIDKTVAFGDIQLSYENEPFSTLLNILADRGVNIGSMENEAMLASMSPWTRMDAVRLLTAGSQVICFAKETEPVKVPEGAKLSMPSINRGMIKEIGLSLPSITLAAPLAGTGIEVLNIDAIFLLARCDKGTDGAIEETEKIISISEGDVTMNGKILKPKEVRVLLVKRSKIIEDKMIGKLAEIGAVTIEI